MCKDRIVRVNDVVMVLVAVVDDVVDELNDFGRTKKNGLQFIQPNSGMPASPSSGVPSNNPI
jgi:hypothetical protein